MLLEHKSEHSSAPPFSVSTRMNSSPVQTAPHLAAQQAANVANAALRKHMLDDTTDWAQLCTPKDTATEIYVKHLPVHVRSLVHVFALKNLGPKAQTRGPDFPFTFKTCSTNGLLTALKTCLAIHAAQLYINGADAHRCLLLCPPKTATWAYLQVIRAAQSIALSESQDTILQSAKASAGAAGVSKDKDVIEATNKTFQQAYANSDFAQAYQISASLRADIRDACTKGCSESRVGKLVLKKLECQAKLETERLLAATEEENDIWLMGELALQEAGVSFNAIEFE